MHHRRSPRLSATLLVALLAALTLSLAVLPAAVAFTEAPTELDGTEQDAPGGSTTDDGTEQDGTTEDGTPEGEEGTTEGETDDVGSELGIVPVEQAPPVVPEETEQPWTQRFLAPIVLLLGALGIVASVLFYGVRVKGRYRIVD